MSRNQLLLAKLFFESLQNYLLFFLALTAAAGLQSPVGVRLAGLSDLPGWVLVRGVSGSPEATLPRHEGPASAHDWPRERWPQFVDVGNPLHALWVVLRVSAAVAEAPVGGVGSGVWGAV